MHYQENGQQENDRKWTPWKITENAQPRKCENGNARPGNSQNGKFTQQEMVENAQFGK